MGFIFLLALFFEQNAHAQTRPKYRTLDGTLNNLSNPNFGKKDIPFFRELPAEYGDGKNALVTNRPNPRLLSNKLSNEPEDDHNDRYMAGMFYSWGQFLDHDISRAKSGTESMPIPLPSSESKFSSPIPFKRSAAHSSSSSVRDQTNGTTSWVDASQVYSTNSQDANWLRTFKGGKLKVSSGNLLPFNTLSGEYSSSIDPNAPMMDDDRGRTVKTFVAGDPRANEHPVLTSLHTLMVREHNRICDGLKYSGLSDEEIYQKARKEVGALMQVVSYGQWISSLGVNLKSYSGYHSTSRPDIMNTFSTAAYRWHTMVENDIIFRNNSCNGVGPVELPLKNVFNNPDIIRKHGIDVLLKGISVHRSYETDLKVNSGLRNNLLGPGMGLDLVAINIQRGRDHGLPNYNTVREFYTGSKAKNFTDIASNSRTSVSSIFDATSSSGSLISSEMQSLYGDVNKVDLWVGLYAEPRLSGKSVGKTVDAILRTQLECLRDGDFYYFENDPALSSSDKTRLKNTKLGDIIKRNTTASDFQDNVFFVKSCSSDPKEFDDISRHTCDVKPNFEGWTMLGVFKEKTYFRWTGSKANFFEAHELVARLGGTLPHVANKDENNALSSFLNGSAAWLDLNLVGKEWRYSNGFNANDELKQGPKSPFFKWEKGEPNGVANKAQIMPSGSWRDAYDNELLTVIAEVPCNKAPKLKLESNEILALEANAQFNRSLIQWVNNTGSVNDYFTVEKMNATTGEFEEIQTVNNTSNDNALNQYTTYDYSPTEGDNNYRIKVIFQDGGTVVSPVKTVVFKGLSEIRVFPNPANDVLNIDLSSYKEQAVEVYLYNYLGQLRQVSKFDKLTTPILEWDVTNEPVGQYMIRVISKNKRDVSKSVVITH